jgi:hypothetical protein
MSDGHTMTNRLAGGVYSRTGGVRTSYSAGVQPFDLEKVTATLFQTTRVVSGGKYKSSPRKLTTNITMSYYLVDCNSY